MIETTSLVAKRLGSSSKEPTVPSAEGLPDAWAGLDLTFVDPEAAQLLPALVRADAPLPEIGAELPNGVTAEMAWPNEHVAVVYADMDAADITELLEAGWTAVRANVEPQIVVDALRAASASPKES